MRTLTFTEKDVEKYELIHEGLLGSEFPLKGINVRLSAKIFDKLEAIGKIKQEQNGLARYTTVKGGMIQLEEPEFSLLIECLNNVSWNAIGARRANKVFDW